MLKMQCSDARERDGPRVSHDELRPPLHRLTYACSDDWMLLSGIGADNEIGLCICSDVTN